MSISLMALTFGTGLAILTEREQLKWLGAGLCVPYCIQALIGLFGG